MHLIQFENADLRTYQWRGRPCWLATDISAALKYSRRGRINGNIRGKWKQQMVDGKDFELLKHREMCNFKALNAGDPKTVGVLDHVNLATILYEPGLWTVLQLCRLPGGVRLRKVLAEDVLPQLARVGRYVPVGARAEVSSKQARPIHVVLRELHGQVSEVSALDRDLLLIGAACSELGLTRSELFRIGCDEPEPTPRTPPMAEAVSACFIDVPHRACAVPLRSAQTLGKYLGISGSITRGGQIVGAAVTALGLREGGPGVSFRTEVLPHGKAVGVRYFAAAPQKQIEQWLRAHGHLPGKDKGESG